METSNHFKSGATPKSHTSRINIKQNRKMANYKIEEIEGIGPALGEKLRNAGITNTDKLLAGSKSKKQRKELAEASGISEKQILKFANMADLFRISGEGQEYAGTCKSSWC